MLRPSGVACDHCGLPVPPGNADRDGGDRFCCAGCATVWEAIHGCGLERYYALREQADAEARPAAVRGGAWSEWDDDAFLDRHAPAAADGLRRADLYLEGVHCGACVWLVERLPHVLPGVVEARLDIRRRVARVVWDPARVAASRVARTLDRLGYTPHPDRSSRLDEIRRAETRRHLVRIGVAGACAGNVMLIAFALYGGMLNGMDPVYESFFRWTSFAIALVALLGPGRVFLRGALSSLRTRRMHMDLPVAIALVLGTLWGGWNTLRGAGEVYFESLTAVIFLLLVGRYVQHRQQRAAQDAVGLLYSLTPATARRVEPDGSTRTVAVEALAAGVVVELRPGDGVPADGVLIDGGSDFDLSLLTGESEPVRLDAGARVHAGTVNLTRRARLRVESTGSETRVGRLMEMVERFAQNRPPAVRLADRVAHRFVGTVLLLAAATAALWLALEPSQALEHAITLLIVTCPCALGLATPLAMQAAIGRAAGEGILVKGGEALEVLAGRGRIWLDKTGTLTRGRLELVAWRGDDALRPAIAAVEARVAHPVASAFVAAFGPASGDEVEVEGLRNVPGRGAEATVAGRRLRIGAPEYAWPAEVAAGWRAALDATLARGLSPVAVAVDGEPAGLAGFGDPVRPEARASVERLRALGWEPGILSGDHPRIVARVAEAVGVDPDAAFGAVAPEAKAERVRAARDAGETVAMVGDGVNDAAALSAASAGIAVHGGAEASLTAADVFFRRPGLGPAVDLVRGARRTLRVMRRNVVVSLAYNVVAGSLAIAGWIDPLIAAILMPLSSLTVVGLSYRSRTFGPRRLRRAAPASASASAPAPAPGVR